MRALRAATAEQAAQLWPAVRATRLFASPEEFVAFRLADPWRVRASEQGEGALLGAWRAHLEVLAIRGLWCSSARIPVLAREVLGIAADHGFKSVLSPLLPVETLLPYRESGFRIAERLVVLQGLAQSLAELQPEKPVGVRTAGPADLEMLATIDSWCFDTFWGYRGPELAEALRTERVVVATEPAGTIVGYATCSGNGATMTVGRLAVDPDARRMGVGTALVRDCAQWALREQAFAVTLCTQEHNTGSRGLYRRLGLRELVDHYALAVCDTARARA